MHIKQMESMSVSTSANKALHADKLRLVPELCG